jgi:hypothetical protein
MGPVRKQNALLRLAWGWFPFPRRAVKILRFLEDSYRFSLVRVHPRVVVYVKGCIGILVSYRVAGPDHVGVEVWDARPNVESDLVFDIQYLLPPEARARARQLAIAPDAETLGETLKYVASVLMESDEKLLKGDCRALTELAETRRRESLRGTL